MPQSASSYGLPCLLNGILHNQNKLMLESIFLWLAWRSVWVTLQDLYSAWIDQGLDWVAVHGQANMQSPEAAALVQPQDLSLSPEQLQLITDYFCKVPFAGLS